MFYTSNTKSCQIRIGCMFNIYYSDMCYCLHIGFKNFITSGIPCHDQKRTIRGGLVEYTGAVRQGLPYAAGAKFNRVTRQTQPRTQPNPIKRHFLEQSASHAGSDRSMSCRQWQVPVMQAMAGSCHACGGRFLSCRQWHAPVMQAVAGSCHAGSGRSLPF
jgi:hypothetical protein